MTTPPNWYPAPEWIADEGDFFHVPEDMRDEYAAVPLTDNDLGEWLKPSTAAFAGVVTDNLPAGLYWTDVAEGVGPDGTPARMGFLASTGGMDAVRARQHEHAVREVREARRVAAEVAMQAAIRTRTCPVYRGRFDVSQTLPVRLPNGQEAAACAACAPVAAAAIVAARGAEFLPDGRTRQDAALSWAVGLIA